MKNKQVILGLAPVAVIVIGLIIGFYRMTLPPKIDKNEQMTSALKSVELSKYIEKISYKVSEKPIDDDNTYAVNVNVKVNDDFDKMNLYEKFKVLKSSVQEFGAKTILPDCSGPKDCTYGSFVVQSPTSKHVIDDDYDTELESFIVDGKKYFNNELFDKFATKEEKDEANNISDSSDSSDDTDDENDYHYYYTKEELEADPNAPSTDPADYNENGEYVPKDGPSDNPADYNAKGEYEPLDSMTSEEREEEMEELLRNNGVGK